jgi:hypothetical protein
MPHHLDTPLAAQNGQLFIDDLYVFPGEGSTVFVAVSRVPLRRPCPPTRLNTRLR